MALDLTRPTPSAIPAKTEQQKTGLAAVIRSKIVNTLAGKKGEQFVTDVVTLVNNNPQMIKCDQVSLIAACLQAQTLNLSLNKNMGQAWIVPFEDKKEQSHDSHVSDWIQRIRSTRYPVWAISKTECSCYQKRRTRSLGSSI